MAHHRLKGKKKPRMSETKKHVKKKESKGKMRKKRLISDQKKGMLPNKKTVERRVAQAATEGKPKSKGKMDLKKLHTGLYQAGESILLVGEGNFSFASALCKHLKTGDGVCATAHDNEATVQRKYADSKTHRECVEKLGGVTLVGVDATRIHEVGEFQDFRKIVWNFPHLGAGQADVENSIREHTELLGRFFLSAVKCLSEEPGSAIHVALKIGEPYKSWKVVQTARAVCPNLHLQTTVPFAFEAWDGYAHRRTQGFDERFSKDDSEELKKGAKVYVFVLRTAPEE
uniref:25S rRNA (uridine-N(3))-methyltransferase BMT5-like domain-containing protein n=1 Tax=Noctiluca scintillans TaxID=2966 RepID=A0A7S1F3I5_NOCSC|mmetsp:Transcript_29639/g.78525  ORF Transcript_29639/g.78525 Transcript_29639/m.78525 type:complete len:286 (+) Transcript_29639:57-914(+)